MNRRGFLKGAALLVAVPVLGARFSELVPAERPVMVLVAKPDEVVSENYAIKIPLRKEVRPGPPERVLYYLPPGLVLGNADTLMFGFNGESAWLHPAQPLTRERLAALRSSGYDMSILGRD